MTGSARKTRRVLLVYKSQLISSSRVELYIRYRFFLFFLFLCRYAPATLGTPRQFSCSTTLPRCRRPNSWRYFSRCTTPPPRTARGLMSARSTGEYTSITNAVLACGFTRIEQPLLWAGVGGGGGGTHRSLTAHLKNPETGRYTGFPLTQAAFHNG